MTLIPTIKRGRFPGRAQRTGTHSLKQHKESGLLLLPVPREYGGAGASWPQLDRVVQILAGASGSIGQIYANHIGLVNAAVPLGRPGQAEQAYQATAQNHLLWANALNARDGRLKIEAVADGFRVNGIKSFGTGVAVGERFELCFGY